MNVETYKKAKKIILMNESLSDFVGERSTELINKVKNILQLNFHGIYLDFLKTFGAGNFGSQEIYGVIDDGIEKSSVPDAIWFTLIERKEVNLPKTYLLFMIQVVMNYTVWISTILMKMNLELFLLFRGLNRKIKIMR